MFCYKSRFISPLFHFTAKCLPICEYYRSPKTAVIDVQTFISFFPFEILFRGVFYCVSSTKIFFWLSKYWVLSWSFLYDDSSNYFVLFLDKASEINYPIGIRVMTISFCNNNDQTFIFFKFSFCCKENAARHFIPTLKA